MSANFFHRPLEGYSYIFLTHYPGIYAFRWVYYDTGVTDPRKDSYMSSPIDRYDSNVTLLPENYYYVLQPMRNEDEES